MEPLSQFVDHFIRKYVATFLGDTTDVLNIIDFRCNDIELVSREFWCAEFVNFSHNNNVRYHIILTNGQCQGHQIPY